MPPKASRAGRLPKNWPSDIRYLTAPIYSPAVNAANLKAIRTQGKDSIAYNLPKGPYSLVKITPISSPTHPANGQSGLFTTADLKPGTLVLQYLGEIHDSQDISTTDHITKPDPHADSDYDLSLDRELGIGIDANYAGNEARFINDYRGIADRPNAEFKEIWNERTKERGIAVWVLPEGKSGKGKGIKKGQEILVSYGRGFWGARKDIVEK
ncbi:hypothetical protein BGZ60DRAFT_397925 [Tricladium varicosporioides]|nr:hypothetical protein BGZ60DRAFT_397925 [Hymenoscyphus varicosporioides]